MLILDLKQIKDLLKGLDILPEIEAGFVAYSLGQTVIPPVGELIFKDPPGDVHIKYGYIREDKFYVIKIASGFYQNPRLNLPSNQGLMLLFDKSTGEINAILLDEGYLTGLRTAAAGAIAAKYLAPHHVSQIGIVGTGVQAYLQAIYLKQVIACQNIMLWGRNVEKLEHLQEKLKREGFVVEITQNIEHLAASSNLIVTTTPSHTPLLYAEHIQKGTHITAVGADSPHKQELDSALFKKADLIVADSIEQCLERGDMSHAIRQNMIHKEDLTELGNIIAGKNKGRTSEEQITIADFTGVAVQDIQIAKAVYKSYPLHGNR